MIISKWVSVDVMYCLELLLKIWDTVPVTGSSQSFNKNTKCKYNPTPADRTYSLDSRYQLLVEVAQGCMYTLCHQKSHECI